MTTTYKEVIKPQRSLFEVRWREIWEYRDLMMTFVRRDYAASYKQTILGPLWHIIQPLFPTIMFTFVFGRIAKISTDGLPQPLFYLSGLVLWGYFSDVFSRSSNVFVSNASIFGKVYFPRLVTPLSFTISSLMRFGSQLFLFTIIWLYFYYSSPSVSFHLRTEALLFPFLVLLMAGFGLGLGLIVSALSTKYRDIGILLGFLIGLLQYATCVIYPLSTVPEKYRVLIQLNPLTSVIETFRYGFMGTGHFTWLSLLYSFGCMVVVVFVGILFFNKVERTFMDTV